MTQEEKARAYDEAIERARRIKNGEDNWRYSDLTEIIPALEEVLPELAESEDERIRKRLIEYFEGFRMGNAEVKWEGLNVQEVLVWLEKQKEQKPAEWSEEDEEILKLLILNIGRYMYFGGMSSERILSFLKSLRPSWKPSEEQMKALSDACCIAFEEERDFHPSLSRLYHDLRKL